MLTNFEIHCLAPWKAICVKSDGLVVPDIQARESLGDLKKQTLAEILSAVPVQRLRQAHADRSFPSSCVNCQLKEQSGGRSRRTFFDDVLRPLITDRNFAIEEVPDVQFLEINASNKCNLKCRMCNGSISTTWLSEESKLVENGFSKDRGGTHKYTKIDDLIFERLFESRDHFRNLKFLALRGGEPFSEPLNFRIIEKIIDWGFAKNVVLDVSTNGTIVNDRLVAYFKEFKKVDLYISLEALGDAYGYIRSGQQFSIKDLEDNIKKLRGAPNLTLIFTVTTMVYNISRIVEIWSWFKKIRSVGDEISFSNTVVRPEYLNYQILPRQIKEKILAEIVASDLPLGVYDTGLRVLRDIGTPALLEGLKNENFFSEEKILSLRTEFKNFNQLIDQFRGTSFEQTLPELADFYANI